MSRRLEALEHENRKLREALKASSDRALEERDQVEPEPAPEPEDAGDETPVKDLAPEQVEPERGLWRRVRRFLGLGVHERPCAAPEALRWRSETRRRDAGNPSAAPIGTGSTPRGRIRKV